MAEYKLTKAEQPCAVIRTADSAGIPPDPANRDYAEYLAWIEGGGVPDPYVAPDPVPSPPTVEQQVLFDHENRIRAQEGAPPLTLNEFILANSKS
jgi:hypothetical protein